MPIFIASVPGSISTTFLLPMPVTAAALLIEPCAFLQNTRIGGIGSPEGSRVRGGKPSSATVQPLGRRGWSSKRLSLAQARKVEYHAMSQRSGREEKQG